MACADLPHRSPGHTAPPRSGATRSSPEFVYRLLASYGLTPDDACLFTRAVRVKVDDRG
jgi:hypothetical protein